MSFARRVLVVALAIQIAGLLREILFVVGPEHFLTGLLAGDPTLLAAGIVLLGSALLIVPVWRGNRWATLASVPLLALLLLAALPVAGPLFANPSPDNFVVWLTITLILIAAAIGVPFGIIATLEAFGRRPPTAAVQGSLFSTAALFVAAAAGSLVGMTVLAVAVAATPTTGGAGWSGGAPDDYATITMRNVAFEPADLRLAAGRTTALFIVNEDAFDHSFDIDELDIHVMVPGGQTAVALVSPEARQTYDVYCAIPGHTEIGMVAELVAD